MNRYFIALFSATFVLALQAGEHGDLIFEDAFERSESQEVKDEPGGEWGSNSASRANGNKQVDLRDGAMYIYFHESADHAVSVTHPAEFRNGAIELRFMLEDAKDSLGLNFADPQYKKVHAGHLFVMKVTPKQVQIQDLKTGNMDLPIRTARKAGKELTAAQKMQLEGKDKKFSNAIAVGSWHDLLVQVDGEKMTVSVDGKIVGSFASEGIAHPTKRLLRLAVPRNAVVDDLKIWRKE